MLYSVLYEGKDCYVNLHGEWLLRQNVLKEAENLLHGKADADILQEIAEESKAARLLMDFAYIEEMEPEACQVLRKMSQQATEEDREVCLFNLTEEMADVVRTAFTEAGVLFDVEKTEGEGVTLFFGKKKMRSWDTEDCRMLTEHIHRENLLILMGAGERGKFFDLKRLWADEELCLQYFFCLLAVKLMNKGAVSAKPMENTKIGIVAVNEYGRLLAEKLAEMLGLVLLSDEQDEKCSDVTAVILVRDVIHMSFEVHNPALKFMEMGLDVKGVVCLTDIHSGFGKRKDYISVYTIDFNKGISYRLKEKKRAIERARQRENKSE